VPKQTALAVARQKSWDLVLMRCSIP